MIIIYILRDIKHIAAFFIFYYLEPIIYYSHIFEKCIKNNYICYYIN